MRTPATQACLWWKTVAALGALLIAWQLMSVSHLVNPALFPPPTVVGKTASEMIVSGELAKDVGISLQRAVIGFLLGSFSGIALGLMTGRIRLVDATVGQLIQILRPIPSIALVPLAIVWFGLGETSKCFLVFWGVLFPVWVNSHLGAAGVDRAYLWAARSLGARPTNIFFEIVLPAALPLIIAGMRTGIAVAFICLVAAEMAGASGGIGFRIQVSHLVFRVDKMMVALATLGILGACADASFAWATARLIPWYQPKASMT